MLSKACEPAKFPFVNLKTVMHLEPGWESHGKLKN